MYKLGIDIHGVTNEDVPWFRFLTSCVIKGGGEVHFITGPPANSAEKELAEMGIKKVSVGFNFREFDLDGHYTHLFSIVDYHRSIGTPMEQDSAGNWHLADPNHPPEYSNYLWDRTKADYCLKHSIDMMVDDSDLYPKFFKTPYARYYSKNKRKHHVNVDTIKG
jgi:hypothetical protein